MTAIFYRNTDAGAPTYNKNDIGSITRIIKACLVTGYGTKPSTGWELIYDSIDHADDNTHRIAVRSKNPSSERCVYEIRDIDSNQGKISIHKDGLNTPANASYVINKVLTGNSIDIIADDVFVLASLGAAPFAFGDYDAINLNHPRSIIMGATSAVEDGPYFVPASTSNRGNMPISGYDGTRYYCRSFAVGVGRYGSMLSWTASNGAVNYCERRAGDPLIVKKTELIGEKGGKRFFAGTMPHLYYTDTGVRGVTLPAKINESGKERWMRPAHITWTDGLSVVYDHE